MFPDRRLHLRDDGQLTGNIIVNEDGAQHPLDNHDPATFAKRVSSYVVGGNSIALVKPNEIALGREETLDALREILKKNGGSPWEIVGHYGSQLTEEQVHQLREWLMSLSKAGNAAA
jgi:hypothetical protein